jgi:hypothetical protein
MTRITQKDLVGQLKRLAHNTNLNFKLYGVYGGYNIELTDDQGNILQLVTHGTKKELYYEVLTTNKILEAMRQLEKVA